MNRGNVLLWRKSLESNIFHNDGLWKVWTWCLMKATWKNRSVPFNFGRGTLSINLTPGQFVFGRKTASLELNMSESTVWKRINKLKKLENLNIKSNNQYSIISIINWDSYQNLTTVKEQVKEQVRNSKGTGKEHKQTIKTLETLKTKDSVENIIKYLNNRSSKNFSPKSKNSIKFINARIKEGFTENDFFAVIDKMTLSWKGDLKMDEYLRPETLFGTKFESYLNKKNIAEQQETRRKTKIFDESDIL